MGLGRLARMSGCVRMCVCRAIALKAWSSAGTLCVSLPRQRHLVRHGSGPRTTSVQPFAMRGDICLIYGRPPNSEPLSLIKLYVGEKVSIAQVEMAGVLELVAETARVPSDVSSVNSTNPSRWG